MIIFISFIYEIDLRPDYYIKDNLLKFNLYNYYQISPEGYPDIPVFPYIIKIDGKIKDFEFKIISVDTFKIIRDVEIAIASKPQVISLPFVQVETIRKDIKEYPEEIVKFVRISYSGESSYIMFSIFSGSYKDGDVILFSKIMIELNYKKDEIKKSQKNDSVELAIITRTDFISYFEPLREWKTKKGIPSKIFDFDSIINIYSGRDNQEKLRNFIKGLYNKYNLKYVILGGDVGIIPARVAYAMCSEAGFRNDEDSLRADLYYADLDGDWDLDGDNVFGEVEDSIDLIPEIAVGRIPVNTSLDVINFVNKLISYEKNPGENIGKYIFSGMILWQNPYTDAGIAKDRIANFLPDYISVSRMYEANGLGYHDTIWKSLNSGNAFFNHNGHGWYTGMWTASGNYISIQDVESLSNTTYTIGFSTGCWVGAFDYNSIAEHFITTDNGCVAMIANSRYGWGSPGNPGFGYSDRFDEMFFRKIFLENYRKIGDALNETKIHFAPLSMTENVYRWHQYQLNLFGDPSMVIWKKIPDTFDLVFVDSNRVKVLNKSNPVESAFVCILGKDYKRFLTDPTGEFTIYEDTFILTITKDDFLPFQIERNYSPIVLFDIFISDSNDNLINPGETLYLSLYVKSKKDTISNRSFKLLSDDINILVDSVFIHQILPGEDTIIEKCFKIYAPHNLMDGENIKFYLVSNDTLSRNFFVASPNITIDNIINLGDTILIKILNKGHTYIDGIVRSTNSFPSSLKPVDTIKIINRADFFIDTLRFPYLFNSTINYILKRNDVLILDTLLDLTDYTEFFEPCENESNFIRYDLWQLTSYKRHSGEYSFYCGDQILNHYLNNQISILESKKFFPKGNINLSFYYWYKFPNYGSDGMYIIISSIEREDTIDFIGSGGALYPIQDGWIKWERNIHVSDTFSLKFVFTSDNDVYDEGIYIDDIILRNTKGMNMDLPKKGEYKIINNINHLNILYNSENNGIIKFKIYDILGRERVVEKYIYRGINNIDLMIDKGGIYFIFLENRFIGKFIILEER